MENLSLSHNGSLNEAAFVALIDGSMVSPTNTSECVPLKKKYVLAVAFLPLLVMVENLFFLQAMFLYRKKLKHNTVYRYVTSALLANLVASSLGFYHFQNYYFGFEPHDPNLWWAFRKGMTLSLSLILCGNIGLLIYGIEDSTYIVGRVSKSKKQSEKLSPVYRTRKANALICLVWFFPTLFGLLAMTPWNCTFAQCDCTLCYENGDPICIGEQCSRVYTPMSKSYLLTIVMLWGLEIIALLYRLCKSVCKVKHSEVELSTKGNKEFQYMSMRRTLAKFDATHRVVFLLFGLFIVCTVPIMVLFVLDFAVARIHFSHFVINVLSPLTLIYCLISPILVAHKLSGVKSALRMALTLSCTNSSSRKRSRSTYSGCTTSLSRASKDFSNGVQSNQ